MRRFKRRKGEIFLYIRGKKNIKTIQKSFSLRVKHKQDIFYRFFEMQNEKKNQKITKKSRLEHASTIYCRIADSILKESHSKVMKVLRNSSRNEQKKIQPNLTRLVFLIFLSDSTHDDLICSMRNSGQV